MFGSELEHETYRYASLILMLKDLGEMFHVVRPDKGDHKLYDGRRPLPSDAHMSYRASEYLKRQAAYPVEQTESALPMEVGISFNNRLTNLQKYRIQIQDLSQK